MELRIAILIFFFFFAAGDGMSHCKYLSCLYARSTLYSCLCLQDGFKFLSINIGHFSIILLNFISQFCLPFNFADNGIMWIALLKLSFDWWNPQVNFNLNLNWVVSLQSKAWIVFAENFACVMRLCAVLVAVNTFSSNCMLLV